MDICELYEVIFMHIYDFDKTNFGQDECERDGWPDQAKRKQKLYKDSHHDDRKQTLME